MSKCIDLIGQKFNRLTVIGRAENAECGRVRWLCDCECGKQIIVIGCHLKSGHTKSCGCLKQESLKLNPRGLKHGHSANGMISKTYETWHGMTQRCANPNCKGYKDYGGRGIKVCEAWLKFEGFFQDMGKKPEGLTLDRIDNDKGYCKENCRWVTQKEQNRNMRSNIMITINDVTKCLAEWCEIYQKPYQKTWRRIINHGLTPEEALEINQGEKILKFKTLDGKEISIQLRKKTLCRNIQKRSKGQENLKNLLEKIYGVIPIFEEFIIPKMKLSLDFFVPGRKIAFEFHGKQHYNINNFFHKTKQDFLKQQARDLRKSEWCQINNITLVEISDEKISLMELKGLITGQILKPKNC